MADEAVGILPPAALKAFRQSLAKCQACLDLTDYLEALGQPESETADRAAHAKTLVEAALELDRQSRASK